MTITQPETEWDADDACYLHTLLGKLNKLREELEKVAIAGD